MASPTGLHGVDQDAGIYEGEGRHFSGGDLLCSVARGHLGLEWPLSRKELRSLSIILRPLATGWAGLREAELSKIATRNTFFVWFQQQLFFLRLPGNSQSLVGLKNKIIIQEFSKFPSERQTPKRM